MQNPVVEAMWKKTAEMPRESLARFPKILQDKRSDAEEVSGLIPLASTS